MAICLYPTIKPGDKNGIGSTRLMFMQSNGGLIDAAYFQGKDSILSGPAGGIVGAVATSKIAGFKKIVTFDMGRHVNRCCSLRGRIRKKF